MRKPLRLYHESLEGDSVTLSAEEAHHAVRVLRLSAGEKVELFDGRGASREGRMDSVGRRGVEIVFTSETKRSAPPEPSITLAVAPPKGRRMDTLLQMSEEIAVDEIVPLTTERSSAGPKEERYRRWRRVVVAAAKQSGNNRLLKIRRPEKLESLLMRASGWDLAIICHNESDISLREAISVNPPASILLAIGPEGGFTREEIELARNAGCAVAGLPAPTLRIETAAVFALGSLCCRFRRLHPTCPEGS